MFYRFRVNVALAKLGIDPTILRGEYRQSAQTIGSESGHSPQEVALFLASQLSIAHQTNLRLGAARSWIRKRKVNVRDPIVRDALGRLAWWDLMEM